jgi:pimeloyl-ACP methyl ester carboxylesterase
VDRIEQALLSASEPSILVGHSLAGAVISQAAERLPERIRCLVYLTAFLLSDGQSRRQLPDVGTSIVQQNLIFSKDHESVGVAPKVCREAFYGECSYADARQAAGRLNPTPTCLFTTPVTLSGERYRRVPRVYIECLRDRAVPLELQRTMQAAVPCARVFSIDTDHSPFLSAPQELARLLLALNGTSGEMFG